MMEMKLWAALFLVGFALGQNQVAEITFIGNTGKLYQRRIPYFVTKNKIAFGTKFGVTIYKIPLEFQQPLCRPRL